MSASVYVDWYGKGRDQAWQTPRAFFDQLNAEFAFDLDGASSPENSLCDEGSTVENPVPWIGRRVFCNPPWTDIASFVELAPHAEIAVLLVPARSNARWFHRALDLGAQVRFFPGRLKFERAERVKAVANSPVDCLLLVWEKP